MGCQSSADTGDQPADPQAAKQSTSQRASQSANQADGSLTGQNAVDALSQVASYEAEEGVTPPENLPTPPGIDRARLRVREGESLKRAQLALPAVLSSLPDAAKSVLPEPASPQAAAITPEAADAVETDTRPMPRAAQLAYITGRIALNEGSMQTAILQLKIASGIAPNEPDIARLLAAAYLRIGNRPAAAMYLQQVLRQDPQDIDSLIKLGRASLERGEWAEAVVLFARSLELTKQTDPASPALEQICEFYLGSALEVGGYDQASVEQYHSSMDGRSELTDKTAARFQVMLLSKQFGVVWQAIGDASLRLGKPADAAKAYDKAVKFGVPNLSDWMSRYVYTQLLLGRPNQATHRMVEFLKSNKPDANSLPLVSYLIKQGGDSRSLAQVLQDIYDDSDKSSAMAQMISNLLPDDQAQTFLLGHLKQRPADLDVAGELIRRVMYPEQAGKAAEPTDKPNDATPDQELTNQEQPNQEQAAQREPTLNDAAKALQTTAQLIQATPAKATDYARVYLNALNNTHALDDVIASAEKDNKHAGFAKRTAVQFMQAVDHLRAGQLRNAQPILESITQQEPAFIPARMLLASQLLARSRWDEASALLDGIDDEPWLSQADNLRVRIYAGQGLTDRALVLLDELIAREPGGVELPLYKAGLQVQAGQVVQGERTLLDLLNVHPREERIYKTLFDLYDRGDVPDVSTQYQRLMIRLFQTMPQSRIAHLQQVEMLMVRREHVQAEKILRDLLVRDAKDFEALGVLARLLQETERGKDADALVEEKLKEMGDDQDMLRFAIQYYQAFKNQEKSYELRERAAKQLKDPAQRAMNLAVLYMQQDKLDQAKEQAFKAMEGELEDPQASVSVMVHVMSRVADATPVEKRQAAIDDTIERVNQVMKQFPEHEADIRYELASFHARMGDETESLQQMARTLEKFPKHAPSNNGLGYSWADKGIHLEKAREMIQIAVDAEPKNTAYLDSLGWVYYKLGKFDDAVLWLSQAATGRGAPSPVILDHLGDAFYRTGNLNKAIQIWRQAQRLLETGDFSADPESARLPDALREKVAAASRKAPAPVAPIQADKEEAQSNNK